MLPRSAGLACLLLAATTLACAPAPRSPTVDATLAASLGPSPEPPREEATRESPRPPVVVETSPVTVEWSQVTRTPTCFFFSGPGSLGRDDQLGTTAEWSEHEGRAGLAFSPLVVFHGVRGGSQVALARTSAHLFGDKWEVSERIDGEIQGGVLEGQYHYDECDTSHRPSCPGPCHIDARVVIQMP